MIDRCADRLRFKVPLDRKYITSETLYPANRLIGLEVGTEETKLTGTTTKADEHQEI